MQTGSNIKLETNIEFRNAKNEKLHESKISNTLTKQGKAKIGELLSSSKKIDSIILSQQTNSGETQELFSDSLFIDILSTYSQISPVKGSLTINFEGIAELAALTDYSVIKSAGLGIGNILISVANTGGIIVDNSPLLILYQIKVTFS